jgi:hypothetical protein
MPKQSQRGEVNNFVGGLITEASPLNFPPNSSADEVNFELFRNGSRKRRLGMDYEPGYQLIPTGLDFTQLGKVGYTAYKWTAAGGNPNANFAVLQISNNLLFFNVDQSAVTGTGLAGQITVSDFPTDVNFSLTDIEGILVVASGTESFAVINYTSPNVFSLSYERILIRDLWGIEETTNPNYETDPTYRGNDTLQHRYNLQNQSWGIPRKGSNAILQSPYEYFNGDLGKFPSNSEQVWAGLEFQSVASSQQPFERMYTNLYDEVLGSKFSSAKGYFIIDALKRGEGRATALAQNTAKYPIMSLSLNFPTDYTPYGPTCVAQFAGRVFFSGFRGEVIGGDKRSPNYANYVFFSQLIKNNQDINKCYQDGDPTSRDASDLVDTDGGFLKVAGAQNIIGMYSMGINLVIIAENGVWALTGGTQSSGFTATSYKLDRLSSFGGTSAHSIVLEGDVCYYWANDGIYKIAKNQFGDLGVVSMTLNTIQTFYQSIPNLSKQTAFGGYDIINKKIRWVYKQGDFFSDSSSTKELIFDSALGVFTCNTIMNAPNNVAEVSGMFQSQTYITSDTNSDVFSGGNAVLCGTDTVTSESSSRVDAQQYLRYFVMVNVGGLLYVTISYYYNTSFRDWHTVDGVGVDAKAYCLTGASTGGDSSIDKQTPYLFLTFIRTEDGVDSNAVPINQSSCLMRSQWNYANQIESNKWSPLVQSYRYRKARIVENLSDAFDTGFYAITSKSKLRGRGKAIALYFETEPYKDCQILGWNISVNINQIA